MSVLRDFQRFYSSIFGGSPLYDFNDKEKCVENFILYMLNRTQSMFKWNNLPLSIPQRDLELIMQTSGCAGIYEYDNTLYAFRGGLGGEPNVYYMPTIFTISNPALGLSVNAKIGDDVIIINNDSLYVGLIPLFRRYATILTENELSLKIALINSRVISLITSDNDNATKSAEKYLKDIESGKLGVISSQAFLEGVKTQPFASNANTNMLTNLIESMQYYKASFFNELGLNANYNMKRESINSGESQLNNDALLPLIDDMLSCRKRCAENVNKRFGTEITVEFNSSWEDNKIELENEQKTQLESSKNGGGENNEPSEN